MIPFKQKFLDINIGLRELKEDHDLLYQIYECADRLSLASVGVNPDPEKFRGEFLELNRLLHLKKFGEK